MSQEIQKMYWTDSKTALDYSWITDEKAWQQYINHRVTEIQTLNINDLPSVPRNCLTQCCIDDTKLQISFKMRDCPTATNDLNSDLFFIRNWCFNNFFTFKLIN